jgi:hypothetical protein
MDRRPVINTHTSSAPGYQRNKYILDGEDVKLTDDELADINRKIGFIFRLNLLPELGRRYATDGIRRVPK